MNRRQFLVTLGGAALTAALTALMLMWRDDLSSASPALVLVVPGVVAAVLGG